MSNLSSSFPASATRRRFVGAGAGFFAGLTVPNILQLRAASQQLPRRDTTVIFAYMGGGPSQFETWDPKPDAPAEYRGKYGAIPTNVDGLQICELLPRQAKLMDKVAIIRSIHHEQASHIAEHIVETGYDLKNNANILPGEMPAVGCVVSKLRGGSPDGIPAYVRLRPGAAYSGPQWLGNQHRSFDVKADPNAAEFAVRNLTLDSKLSVARLEDRRGLLSELDRQKGALDTAESAGAIDEFTSQAFHLVTGDAARNAFDIGQEPDAVRDRYGRTEVGQRLLLARRLAEAGVPFIKVRNSAPDWDDHQDMDKRIQQRVPGFDQSLSALIEDLHERGLNRKVLLVAMGEFGRTPRINANGGRDHWPAVGVAMICGGDYKMGQVIGSTDAYGASVESAPYRPQNVLAMIYRHLGINPEITFDDFSGRPRYILEERRPIVELLG